MCPCTHYLTYGVQDTIVNQLSTAQGNLHALAWRAHECQAAPAERHQQLEFAQIECLSGACNVAKSGQFETNKCGHFSWAAFPLLLFLRTFSRANV